MPTEVRGGIRGDGKPSVGPPPKPQMGGKAPFTVANPVVVFLYKLLRDHVAPGDVEGAVLEAEGTEVVSLTNRFLAEYAVNIATRLGDARMQERARSVIEGLLRAGEVSETDQETDRRAAREWLATWGYVYAEPPVEELRCTVAGVDFTWRRGSRDIEFWQDGSKLGYITTTSPAGRRIEFAQGDFEEQCESFLRQQARWAAERAGPS